MSVQGISLQTYLTNVFYFNTSSSLLFTMNIALLPIFIGILDTSFVHSESF